MCHTSLSEILSDQLAPIFTQIFNRSLELCKVPLCFKRSTIISIPKKSKITWLNYYSTKKKHYINVTNYYYYYRPVKLLKFADETILIGFIQDGDESAYRQEVKELVVWCRLNNLELNTFKTVEMIVDFRRNPPALPPLTIIQVPGHHHLLQPKVWHSHLLHCWKGRAEVALHFVRWGSSTWYRSCWNSSALPSLNLCSALL